MCAPPLYERWQVHRFQHSIVRSRAPPLERSSWNANWSETYSTRMRPAPFGANRQTYRGSFEASDGKQRTTVMSLNYPLTLYNKAERRWTDFTALMAKNNDVLYRRCCLLIDTLLSNLPSPFYSPSSIVFGDVLRSLLLCGLLNYLPPSAHESQVIAIEQPRYSARQILSFPSLEASRKRLRIRSSYPGDSTPPINGGISGGIRNSWIFRRPMSSCEKSQV